MKDEIKEIEEYKEIEKSLIKEINKLTAESTEWESKCYDLQKEIKGLKENKLTPDELVNLLNQELIKQRDDYKSRNKKAIEYCELNKEFTPRLEDVENILNGGDKDV